jgi:hypothetical protein
MVCEFKLFACAMCITSRVVLVVLCSEKLYISFAKQQFRRQRVTSASTKGWTGLRLTSADFQKAGKLADEKLSL